MGKSQSVFESIFLKIQNLHQNIISLDDYYIDLFVFTFYAILFMIFYRIYWLRSKQKKMYENLNNTKKENLSNTKKED